MRKGVLALLAACLAAAPSLRAAPSSVSADQAAPLVASVRIDAPPEQASRLAQYVEMRTGEPLDPVVLRHVVELIHATGVYEDVVVEAIPGPAGLEVVVRPVPALLFGRVVVEGDDVIDADEIARRTRLRHGEPLWPGRLEGAGREVALLLEERGWLEAHVEAVGRPSPDGAAAAFRVQAGPRARVGKVNVAGSPAALEGPLTVLARPRRGKVFERPRAKAAAERLRRALVDRGHWRAAVRVEESYDPRVARMDLVFRVEKGPLLAVEVRGDGAVRGLSGVVEDVVREGAAQLDALEAASERIEDTLRARGHREPVVERREQERGGRLVLFYDVTSGPLARVASVSVVGDVPPGQPWALATRPGEPLQDRVVAEDARSIVGALEEAGHVAPRVDVEVPDGGGDLPVTFRARAGPPVIVKSVEVRSPVPLTEDSPLRELRLRVGAPYRVRDLARDRDTVLAAYQAAGHLEAEVTPEGGVSEDGKEAWVVLHVRPGPTTRVDHVVIAGLLHTREQVVRRELLVEPGKPLSTSFLLESQRRLSGLGLFERVSITEVDPESRDARSVVVRVEEAPRTSVSYGIGYAERERVRGSVEVTRRNLFGMDRRLSVFARASFSGFRLLASYREPYLLGRKQELFVTAYREDEDRPAFSFVRQGVTVQTARPLSPTWSLILRETFEEGRTFNTEEECLRLGRELCPHTLSGPSASVVHDSRDDPFDPRRGVFLVTDAQLSHRWLGGSTLVKAFVQASGYQLVQSRTVLAVSARLGLGRTFGTDESILLPKPDRFFAGGDYTLRGFGTDDVRPDGGNALVVGAAELRLRLFGSLWAATFAEAGNVYALVSELTLADVRYTAGAGLRYRSAVGPLRFDWGYKLDRRPGDEKAYHLHFTIGHAF